MFCYCTLLSKVPTVPALCTAMSPMIQWMSSHEVSVSLPLSVILQRASPSCSTQPQVVLLKPTAVHVHVLLMVFYQTFIISTWRLGLCPKMGSVSDTVTLDLRSTCLGLLMPGCKGINPNLSNHCIPKPPRLPWSMYHLPEASAALVARWRAAVPLVWERLRVWKIWMVWMFETSSSPPFSRGLAAFGV